MASVIRLVNFMSTRLFRGASRRKTNPQRLACVIAVHDRDADGEECRPHIHLVAALPSGFPMSAFEKVWTRALAREPFVYRRSTLEPVDDLRAALKYLANPIKSSAGAPIVYLPSSTHSAEGVTHEPKPSTSNVAEHCQLPG